MGRIIRKGQQGSGLSSYKFPRFFPDLKPGDAYGYEDQEFLEKRKEINRKDIEEEIQSRIAKKEVIWQGKIEQAHAKGIQEGLEQGRRQGLQEIEPTVDLLRQWMQILDAEKSEFFRGLEDSLLKLSVFIAEKIISREIRQDPKLIKNLVSSALARISHGGKLNIRVHREDLEMVRAMSLQEFLPQGIAGDITIEADQKVGKGGCVIETPGGVIDAQIHTQLAELSREVFGEEYENPLIDAGNPSPNLTELTPAESELNERS
jgi:flagellar assembly protein FliH